MKRNIFSIAVIAATVFFSACKKDNFDAPSSTLKGRVVYQGQPLGVRTPTGNSGGTTLSGVQLELWQHGYQLFQKIPVYVAQDGTFSASLFDGDYKLVLLKGSGPWVDKTDSIDVHVQGTANVDVPVTPYFLVKNESFQKSGTTINATAKVDQVVTTKAIERATLYISSTQFVDDKNFIDKADLTGTALADLSQPLSFSKALSSSLSGKDYVFVRIGVKATGVSELIYTQVQKIALK